MATTVSPPIQVVPIAFGRPSALRSRAPDPDEFVPDMNGHVEFGISKHVSSFQSEFKVSGSGIHSATIRQVATFQIERLDERGAQVSLEHMDLTVDVRGVQKVRAQLTSDPDAMIMNVSWSPKQSGRYEISILAAGISIAGSPFTVDASTPEPCAAQCVLHGVGQRRIIAREVASFEVSFRDQLGVSTTAAELDVFVERPPHLEQLAATVTTSFTSVVSAADGAPELAAEHGQARTDDNHPAVHACRQYLGDVRALVVQPLVVRADVSLDSPRLCIIPAGTIVYVLQLDQSAAPKRLRGLVVPVDASDAVRPQEVRDPNPLVRSIWKESNAIPPGEALASARAELSAHGEITGDAQLLRAGWVSLTRNRVSALTVQCNLPLHVNEKALHLQQWERRMRKQREEVRQVAQQARASSYESTKKGASQRSVAPKEVDFHKDELVPPTLSGSFAYGGLYPGVLHAKGVIHERHKLSFSVGMAGDCLLHVRLRREASPLPGSPFLIRVEPGPPFAPATPLSLPGHCEVSTATRTQAHPHTVC